MNKGIWKFGTKEVVYAAIGAALYGVLSWASNAMALPAAGNISLRPAVAIPMFFGVAFGIKTLAPRCSKRLRPLGSMASKEVLLLQPVNNTPTNKKGSM